MVTGAFDWLANGDLFSPGIILVVMLVACLAVVMFNVIQADPNIAESQGVFVVGTIQSRLWPRFDETRWRSWLVFQPSVMLEVT